MIVYMHKCAHEYMHLIVVHCVDIVSLLQLDLLLDVKLKFGPLASSTKERVCFVILARLFMLI